MLKANDGISEAGELQQGAIHSGPKREDLKRGDLDAELKQAARLKDKAESLSAFIKGQGGINACAANFSELGVRKKKVKVARRIWE
jgi:hypothetical protein